MKNLFFALLFLSLPLKATTLSQNDISILFPLPRVPLAGDLLKPSDKGTFGALLASDLYAQIPILEFASATQTYQRLRVVAARLDPCFPLDPPAQGCQPQIRFIWQPLVHEADGTPRTIDAAVHTFYDLTKSQLDAVVKEMELLKATTPRTSNNEPLQVHPQLQKEGLGGAYSQELFQILLANTGRDRVSRVTFMQLAGQGNAWIFGGFIVDGNQFNTIEVARVGGKRQTFVNNPIVPTYFQFGRMNPNPEGADTLKILIANSRDLSRADEPAVIEATMSAARIENPNFHNPHTVDCVSCHIAQPARIWATRQYPWLTLDLRIENFRFKSQFNLENTSPHPENTMVLRGFGYNGNEPAISQRVINETSQILQSL